MKLKLVGYSEGGTQAVSLAARFIELKLPGYEVTECISIGGGGLAGAQKQQEADPLEIFRETRRIISRERKRQRAERKNKQGVYSDQKIFRESLEIMPGVALHAFRVSTDLIKADQNFQGRAHPKLGHDIYNIGKWAVRFATTGFPQVKPEDRSARRVSRHILKILQFVAGRFKNKRWQSVPYERLKAIFSINRDYKIIMETPGTKLLVLGENFDLFFRAGEVQQTLTDMIKSSSHPRQAAQKTLYVNLDATHDFAHNYPNGMAFCFRLLEDMLGWD